MSADYMDWLDPRREDRLKFLMVSPTNPDEVYGELDGVDLSASSIDFGYYTDTRASASLSFVGDGWTRGSFIRIVHEVPEWGYSNVLGTFVPTNDDGEWEYGRWKTKLTLHSVLKTLSTEKLTGPFVRKQGASALSTFQTLCSNAGRRCDTAGACDARAANNEIYETGSTIITHLFDLADAANDRLDVDGYGTVTLRPYVAPASKVSKYVLDTEGARGATYGDVSRSTDYLEIPDTVAVQYKYQDADNNDQEIVGIARLANSPHTRGVRGYSVTDFRTVNELSPATQATADALAKQYLAKGAVEQVEWELSTIYLPLWEGDVVDLVVRDGEAQYQGTRKCLVKSGTIDLEHMRMKLTLKETASGDWDDDE